MAGREQGAFYRFWEKETGPIPEVPYEPVHIVEQDSRQRVAQIDTAPLFQVEPDTLSDFQTWGDQPTDWEGWGVDQPADLAALLERRHRESGAQQSKFNEVWAKVRITNMARYKPSSRMSIRGGQGHEKPYHYRLIPGFGAIGIVDQQSAVKGLRKLMGQERNGVITLESFHLGQLTDTPSRDSDLTQ